MQEYQHRHIRNQANTWRVSEWNDGSESGGRLYSVAHLQEGDEDEDEEKKDDDGGKKPLVLFVVVVSEGENAKN